jgi:hypothetical protein
MRERFSQAAQQPCNQSAIESLPIR